MLDRGCEVFVSVFRWIDPRVSLLEMSFLVYPNLVGIQVCLAVCPSQLVVYANANFFFVACFAHILFLLHILHAVFFSTSSSPMVGPDFRFLAVFFFMSPSMETVDPAFIFLPFFIFFSFFGECFIIVATCSPESLPSVFIAFLNFLP